MLELVREQGYDAVTMDAIAARTKSSKATLYRQWESKPTLVVTALRSCKPVIVADIDTGTLAGDLREILWAVAERATESTELMQSLAHAILLDVELDRAFREMLINPELAALDATLHRAVARGEITADNPVLEYVAHMLIGALTARPLIEDRPADGDYLIRYLERVVLPALRLT